MDFAIKCSLSFVTPTLLYISKQDYQLLLAILIIANPFAITLLISSIKHIIENDSNGLFRRSSNKNKPSHEISKTNTSKSFLCCTYKKDKMYLYFKYWLISSHLTFLLAFQYYIIGSLTISGGEIILLYSSYIILLLSILNLKICISRVTRLLSIHKLSSAMPLADNNLEQPKVNSTKSSESCAKFYNCDGICYLKMLSYPIIINDKNMDWISYNENISHPLDTTSLEICSNIESCLSNDAEKTSTNFWLPIITLRKMMKFNSRSMFILWPTQNSYLMLCNVLHMITLAQMFYLNTTFACACNISRLFGKYLLIPVECSDVYDSLNARVAIFIGVYSAQILLCHLAFICKPFCFRTK